MSTLVQQFLYACILHLLYCFVLTNIHEIYMLKVESNCWSLNLPLCWLNTFYLEPIALWVNSYAKLFDACLESTIHEKFLLIWFSCLLIIYLLANYRPLTWITSFITCDLQYYLIKIMIVACHLRNYFVLAWGCLIRLKRIYNFWCSMLILYQLLCVLHTLHSIFMHFLGLTY